MVDKKMLAQISRGIRAAEQVRNAYNSGFRSNPDISGMDSRTEILTNVLATVAEFYPGTSRNHFSHSLNLSTKYLSNYRNVKNYINNVLKQLD